VRIILFVLGYKLLLKRFFAWKNRNQDKELAKVAKKRKFSAFFWLIAHLLCSIVWLSFGRPLVISLFLSAILQELARGGYYLLLHKAQRFFQLHKALFLWKIDFFP
jgi:hypothetical protein